MMRKKQGYRRKYNRKEDRTKARHQKVRSMYLKAAKVYEHDDVIDWLSDKYFLAPKTVSDIVFGRNSPIAE